MSKNIIITGSSSGFGALTARQLADDGHTVYAGMRDAAGADSAAASAAIGYARDHGVTLIPVAMDVTSQEMVEGAIQRVITETGRIDVVIHNAGHMVLGPAEAFTVEQLAEVYDVNVVSTQRVNRAALPHMRAARDGLLVWVGSSSARGGTPPYLAPYFAAKAAEDSLAVSYAAELARFGIDTTIIVPGAFPTGTNHYQDSGRPVDHAVEKDYDQLYAESPRRYRHGSCGCPTPMPTRPKSPGRSPASSGSPRDHGRSASTSTPCTTARRPSSTSATASARTSTAGSDSKTSSRPLGHAKTAEKEQAHDSLVRLRRARIVSSGRTRDGATIAGRPHLLRRGAAVDHVLWAPVIRYARCADSGLDPDQWFPVSVDPAGAPRGRPCDRDLHRLPGPGRLLGVSAAALGHRPALCLGRAGHSRPCSERLHREEMFR